MSYQKLLPIIGEGFRVKIKKSLISKPYRFTFEEPPIFMSNPEILDVVFKGQPKINESLSMQMTGLVSGTVTRPTRKTDLNEGLSMQMTGLVSGTVTRPIRNVNPDIENASMVMPSILEVNFVKVAVRMTAETDNVAMSMPQILEVTLT